MPVVPLTTGWNGSTEETPSGVVEVGLEVCPCRVAEQLVGEALKAEDFRYDA
jgi:hypothetical protein